ncbi:MAG: polyprenyl synthetase family protein [Desulfobacterales bacterium]|nr:polyprenyl synthetase family protein [Desulfobacterales bacterium]
MISAIAELAHNGSVIIDDVEDQSVTRRGEPTIHLGHGLVHGDQRRQHPLFLRSRPLPTIGIFRRISADAIYRGHRRDVRAGPFRAGPGPLLVEPGPGSQPSGADRREALGCIPQAHAFKSAAAVRATADVCSHHRGCRPGDTIGLCAAR